MLENIPHDLNAEFSVIGSILLEPSLLPSVSEKVTSRAFYDERNAIVYEHLLKLFQKRKKIDMVTLVDSAKGDKQDITKYVMDIMQIVTTSANINAYVEILIKKEKQRNVLNLAKQMVEAVEENQDIDEISSIVTSEIKVLNSETKSELKEIHTAIRETFDVMDELAKNENVNVGHSTGFIDLDKLLNGLKPTDLIILGGRPAMGKTSLALNIGYNVATNSGKKVAIYSLEMATTQLTQKFMAISSCLSLEKINSAKLDKDEWSQLIDGTSVIPNEILINDKASMKVSQIYAQCEKVENLGLIIVDYLGLLKSDGRAENRTNEVSEISRSLKIMAKDLKVPVLCLAQLSRNVEYRTDKRPMMADLRESGGIEADSDSILFVYRDEYYNENSEDRGITEVIVAKNRHGKTGTVKLGWIGECTMFANLYKEK